MKAKLLFTFFIFLIICSGVIAQSINPNYGYRGQHISTTITFASGSFSIGSGPTGNQDIYLQQGSTVIYADVNYQTFLQGDSLWADFSIPQNSPTGLYNVVVLNYFYDWGTQTWSYINVGFANGFTVTGNDANISGVVYADQNSNGLQDVGETGLGNHRISITPLNIVALTDPNGNYSMYVDSGTYTVSYSPPFSYTQTSSPASYNVTVPPDTSGNDFGAYSSQFEYHQQLNGYHGVIRCTGGSIGASIINYDAFNANGSLTIILSPNLSASTIYPGNGTNLGDTVRWNYSGISYGNNFSAYVNLHPVNAGQLVWYYIIDSLFDNSGNFLTAYMDSFMTVSRCSYDPNDKHVMPFHADAGNRTPMDHELAFTINFQNTGNDTAFNITLVDTMSSSLDLNTLEISGSSHPVSVQYSPSGEVRFNFRDILLPDSTTDETGSHGFVSYRIHPVASLPDPTIVRNTAYIYFDYNSPVITNSTITTFTNLPYPSALFNSGSPSVCANDCVQFHVPAQAGTTFNWSFPGGTPSTSTDTMPTVCYANAGSYNVLLIATNALGNDTLLQPLYVQVAALPATPSLVQSNDSLIAPVGYSSYQWFYNGSLIPGETGNAIQVVLDGDYSLFVTNASGCQSSVTMLNVQVGIENLISEANDFVIFPNPSAGSFRIAFKSFDKEVRIELLNNVGSVINYFNVNTAKNLNEVELNDLPSGMYTIRLIRNSGVSCQKVFVQN
ncbi:MAG: T9SS type A sorting domain-containing protein [Bacteroidia bacterium]